MSVTLDILRLRVLLCFLHKGTNHCTVTEISRTLNEKKYTISRMLIALEKEQLINRSNVRQPMLTESGLKQAKYYEERVETALNHLLYEGVALESARRDAFYWALYCTDQTMDVIRDTEERYRIKYELRDRKSFSGATLCKAMRDGSYLFPFLIYRDQVKNGNILSMGNEGFEHPCVLCVKDGIGTIQLRCVHIKAHSAVHGKQMRGKVKSLQYFDSGIFGSAEINGNSLQFPAGALNFVSLGTGAGQILHGSVCVKLQCTLGPTHMPESTAIFTMMI